MMKKKKFSSPQIWVINIHPVKFMATMSVPMEDTDEELDGDAREENNMGDIFNNSQSIWDNAW